MKRCYIVCRLHSSLFFLPFFPLLLWSLLSAVSLWLNAGYLCWLAADRPFSGFIPVWCPFSEPLQLNKKKKVLLVEGFFPFTCLYLTAPVFRVRPCYVVCLHRKTLPFWAVKAVLLLPSSSSVPVPSHFYTLLSNKSDPFTLYSSSSLLPPSHLPTL